MAHSTNSNAAPLPPLFSPSSPNFYADIRHCQTLWARWLFRTSLVWFQSSWNMKIIYCGRIFFFWCYENSGFLVLSMTLNLFLRAPSFLLQALLLRIHNLISGMNTIKASWSSLFQLSLRIFSLILWVLSLLKICGIFLKDIFLMSPKTIFINYTIIFKAFLKAASLWILIFNLWRKLLMA